MTNLLLVIPNMLLLSARLMVDPRVPAKERLLVAGAIVYALMPFDFIPDMLPFVGQVDDAYLIALTLLLTVASGGLGMALPVVLLIVGMRIAPLSAAVADHFGVLGVGLALAAPVIAAPPRLAFRLAAHRLVGAPRGRLKGLLAIRAAAWRDNHFLRGSFRVQP